MRQRSFGDVVKAFLAFVALLVLLVGVPFALATQIGWPLPNEVPSLDRLEQRLAVGPLGLHQGVPAGLQGRRVGARRPA
ncbi:hypothetical protein ABZ322_24335, partial [Streptomyces sp. NPDC006129]|uniref:hypothetical protein n=1 Tax=Streptomyces sp. NPDC006129 TaxID=3155348 RepID=UPI0033B4240F